MPVSAFTRIIVIRNPKSTRAARSLKRIEGLKRIFGEEQVTVAETVEGEPMAYRQLLRRYASLLGPQTLLCIAAGDGTIGMIIEALIDDHKLPKRARLSPVLPLWGGNANDLAHMLNGPAYLKSLRSIIDEGNVVPIYPLACRLKPPRGKAFRRLAACYVSFGATAFAAARLNDPDIRNHPLNQVPGGRLLNQAAASFNALAGAPTFAVNEHGQTKAVYERTFANGSRFAKTGLLPLKLTDNQFYLHTLENRNVLHVFPRLVTLMLKPFRHKFAHERADFIVEGATTAQFDGEPLAIAAGTKVRVTLAERPFYALSTVLTGES